MLVIYSGDIGIYLNVDFTLPYNFNVVSRISHPIAVKHAKEILGEQGLLKGAKRGATCIAISEVQAFTLTADQYAFMVESFHKSEMFKNIKFLSNLHFTEKFQYSKVESFAKSLNSMIVRCNQTLISEGSI